MDNIVDIYAGGEHLECSSVLLNLTCSDYVLKLVCNLLFECFDNYAKFGYINKLIQIGATEEFKINCRDLRKES